MTHMEQLKAMLERAGESYEFHSGNTIMLGTTSFVFHVDESLKEVFCITEDDF